MEFNELSAIWKQAGNEQAANASINEHLLRQVTATRIRSSLRTIRWSAWFELIVGFFWLSFLAGFIRSHISEMTYLLPALVLLLISLYSMAIDIWQLILHYRISADDGVIMTQTRLEKLRYLEKLDTLALLIIIPLFSIPFFIVGAKGLLDFNFYLILGILGEYVIYYCIGSLLIAIILVFLLIRFPNKELRKSIEFLRSVKKMDS